MSTISFRFASAPSKKSKEMRAWKGNALEEQGTEKTPPPIPSRAFFPLSDGGPQKKTATIFLFKFCLLVPYTV